MFKKTILILLVAVGLLKVCVSGQTNVLVTDIDQGWSILKVPQPFNPNSAAPGEDWITNLTTGLLNSDWSWDVRIADIAFSQVGVINQIGNNARPIWITEDVCSYTDDITQSITYHLRNTFEVLADCKNVSSAILRYTADNLSRVYINGEQIVSNNGLYQYFGASVNCTQVCGQASNALVNIPPATNLNSHFFDRVEIADIQPYLKPGINVIAIEAINVGGCNINYAWFCGNLEITYLDNLPVATLDELMHSQCEVGGGVTIGVSGGTAPYLYQLDDGFLQQNGQFSNVTPGTHTVTVTDQAGCANTIIFTIENTGELPVLSLGEADVIIDCENPTTFIEILTENAEGVNFSLDGGPFSEINFFEHLSVGIHTVTAQNVHGCKSLPITFEVFDFSDFIVKNTQATICFGDSFQFDAQSLSLPGVYLDTIFVTDGCDSLNRLELEVLDKNEAIYTYELCQGDSIMVGEHYYSEAGDFVTVKQSEAGCDSFIVIQIDYIPPIICRSSICNYFIPNAFTPNSDGINDYFFVETSNVIVNFMAIYNRWGDVVFTTSQNNPRWDGYFKTQPAENGVYVYIIRGHCTHNEAPIVEYGNVTILR